MTQDTKVVVVPVFDIVSNLIENHIKNVFPASDSQKER